MLPLQVSFLFNQVQNRAQFLQAKERSALEGGAKAKPFYLKEGEKKKMALVARYQVRVFCRSLPLSQMRAHHMKMCALHVCGASGTGCFPCFLCVFLAH
jgi:hypothetical protein